ncbi:uncharacterized protein LOC118278415 [Spodoptera frugiperda]|uniref:Uncharacterized protein LOC118278415 n=1 Tax=Spodoptera frugiperda TaxID=7108 RepID=A0A9R0ERV5_SPOFR|nr:uncharacterized protein LOC118278415 [Spodoptera frugiperda]
MRVMRVEFKNSQLVLIQSLVKFFTKIPVTYTGVRAFLYTSDITENFHIGLALLRAAITQLTRHGPGKQFWCVHVAFTDMEPTRQERRWSSNQDHYKYDGSPETPERCRNLKENQVTVLCGE